MPSPTDKSNARPGMPVGSVRTRRLNNRRKSKNKTDQQSDSAIPNSTDLPQNDSVQQNTQQMDSNHRSTAAISQQIPADKLVSNVTNTSVCSPTERHLPANITTGSHAASSHQQADYTQVAKNQACEMGAKQISLTNTELNQSKGVQEKITHSDQQATNSVTTPSVINNVQPPQLMVSTDTKSEEQIVHMENNSSIPYQTQVGASNIRMQAVLHSLANTTNSVSSASSPIEDQVPNSPIHATTIAHQKSESVVANKTTPKKTVIHTSQPLQQPTHSVPVSLPNNHVVNHTNVQVSGNMIPQSIPMASMEMLQVPYSVTSHQVPPGYQRLVYPQYHMPMHRERTMPVQTEPTNPSPNCSSEIPTQNINIRNITQHEESSMEHRDTSNRNQIPHAHAQFLPPVSHQLHAPTLIPTMYSNVQPVPYTGGMPLNTPPSILAQASAMIQTSAGVPCTSSGVDIPPIPNSMIQIMPSKSTITPIAENSPEETDECVDDDEGETTASEPENTAAYSPLPTSAVEGIGESSQTHTQSGQDAAIQSNSGKRDSEQAGQTSTATPDALPPRQLQCLKPAPKKDVSRSRLSAPVPAGDVPSSSTMKSEPIKYQRATPCVSASNEAPKAMDIKELDKLITLVASVKCRGSGQRAKPLICQDITNSNADTLHLSRLPPGVTYDKLRSIVEPFGEITELNWTAADPYFCEVIYKDPSSAHEAKHFLGGAIAGDAGHPLKAELHSRESGAQLFIGDLTPDVTEEMLERKFTEIAGEPVSALLKRDPESFSPIGYGFLTFRSETAAKQALEKGHRIRIGKACVRVGRAERNTHLYVSDLAPDVTMDDLKKVFGKFGSLVEEDTVIVRRSYAFIRYKNRTAAEKAKRTLDKTDLKGYLSVRYAEAEPLKAVVAVQFHSSVPRPPNSLRDLLLSTFSKHGNCSVEIPRLANGAWRRVAFVTFHGEPIAANTAALEAVQSVRFVSSFPVCCQFARELIPRIPARGVIYEKQGIVYSGEKHILTPSRDRTFPRSFVSRRTPMRQNDHVPDNGTGNTQGGHVGYDQQRSFTGDGSGHQSSPDFVPVYVPLSALHQQNGQVPGNTVPTAEGDYSSYQWPGRMMISNNTPTTMHMQSSGLTGSYNSFAPLQDRNPRW